MVPQCLDRESIEAAYPYYEAVPKDKTVPQDFHHACFTDGKMTIETQPLPIKLARPPPNEVRNTLLREPLLGAGLRRRFGAPRTWQFGLLQSFEQTEPDRFSVLRRLDTDREGT
jgi:hypothetical protein